MEEKLNAVGLGAFCEEDEFLDRWIINAVAEGRRFKGYSDYFYTHKRYGDIELYTYNCNESDSKISILDAELNVSGHCVWDVSYVDISFENQDENGAWRLAAVKNEENEEFTVIKILNADILPSFLEDDKIKMQVCAFPWSVKYYESMEELADTVEECSGLKVDELNGKKILPALGTVLPMGMLNGHYLDENGTFKNDSTYDDVVVITGKVLNAYEKKVKFEEDEVVRFIVTSIDTNFGPLDIVQSYEMIKDDFEKIKPENIIQVVGFLSGDPAILDYENGVIFDERNHLAALRYAMMRGKAERLWSIMTEDIIYDSVSVKEPIIGKRRVIDYLNYVNENTKTEYYSCCATLQGNLQGEKCFVLASNEADNFTEIVRIEMREGLISKIIVTDDAALSFRIENADGLGEERFL